MLSQGGPDRLSADPGRPLSFKADSAAQFVGALKACRANVAS